MTISSQLETVLGKIKLDKFVDENGPPPAGVAANKNKILFFPRKRLKLKRQSSESKAWLIDERLTATSEELENSTEFSGKGLTSGLRSGIIRDDEGNYFRLKGIAPKTHLAQGRERGICSAREAYIEQTYAGVIQGEWCFKVMEPAFVEAIPVPKKEISFARLMTNVPEHKKIFYPAKGKNEDFHKFVYNFSEDFSFVSGFKISGDTRLDEAIYHLTKKRLSGSKKADRDDLLHHLCFYSGASKAVFGDAAWSSDLKYTNAHIGNFVIYKGGDGYIKMGMVDFASVTPRNDFNPGLKEKAFEQHLDDELESFGKDFHCGTACFGPTFLPYKYLSSEVAQSCFDALKTGYAMAQLHSQHEFKYIQFPTKLEKVVSPSTMFISDEEFRQRCRKIMN